jgi:hypothetical protein
VGAAVGHPGGAEELAPTCQRWLAAVTALLPPGLPGGDRSGEYGRPLGGTGCQASAGRGGYPPR